MALAEPNIGVLIAETLAMSLVVMNGCYRAYLAVMRVDGLVSIIFFMRSNSRGLMREQM